MSSGIEEVHKSAPEDGLCPNIVCVHGYGSISEATWHHEETGKSWIRDAEFLRQLELPCRVLSYTYNGAVSANLSAAAIVFHANDLLACLEQALSSVHRGPIFFVAHSWGGLLVKKAIHLCWTVPHRFPNVKRLIAGLFFLGTPHISNDVRVLLQAIQLTVAVHGPEDEQVPESEIRQYATAVCKVNGLFARAKPHILHIESYWEKQPTKISLPSGETSEELIIPKGCIYSDLECNTDNFTDCSHADLARFSSPLDQRFVHFIHKLRGMVTKVMAEDGFSDLPPLPKPALPARRSDPISRPSSPESEASEEPSDTSAEAGSELGGEAGELDEETSARLAAALRSLHGWTEENTGSHLSLAPRTCEWIADDPDFRTWKTHPLHWSLFCLGMAAQGKTYLAREAADHLKVEHPADITMAFFCVPGEERPSIWEYFTREILSRQPSLCTSIPSRYHDRDEDSPPVSLGAFIEIWRGFRAARPCRYIYLLVDGLEQCGDECFEEFCSTVEKIQMPILLPTRTLSQPPDERPPLPAVLKVLYTCRRTPAVDGRLSPGAFWIRPSFTAKDIGAYVDWELRRLRGEGVQDNERLNALKTQIKHSAGCFWPYARFAVEQVAQSFPLPAELTFDSEGLMPIGLKSSLDEYVQSCLRSKTDERYMATVLTFMASCRVAGPVRVRDIEDMLRGVHDEEDLQGINVARSLSANYSGMFFVDPENRMSFLHDSVAYCMADLLSPEQKYTNLAFTCLNYLLRDTFCRRLPLSEKESAESDDWLLANHPFYNYAANSWLQHLRRADNLAIQLLPLLRAFLDKDCSQYKTWCSWRDWRHSKTPGVSSHAEPIAALLTQVGCVNILAHVLSPPDAPPGQGLQGALRSWISRCGPGDGDEEGFLETENWPEVMDGEGYTALMLAIQNGAADVIDFVLQWDPDVNARSASGTNPLMVSLSRASETDRSPPLNLLEELLRRGANPNTSDNDGLTALHHACALGYLEATRLLLDHGALVHIASAKGISPLEEAFNGRSTGVFAELIDRGADADAMWSMGEVPLSQCVIKGELDIFRILLDVADVNQINGEGATALLVACSRGDRHEHIRLLLSRPGLDLDFVDRNWQTNFEGTPHNSLSLSAHKGDYLATEMLLSAGADPGLVPRLPVLPLYRAVRNGHLEIARLLLAHQSPVNNFTRLCGSRTPLSAAVRTGSVDMVALLLEHGADPTVEDAYGSDGPLLRALTGDPPKLEIIGRLLQARIPPDMGAAKGGESALVNKAVRTRNVDVLRMVLEHTSDSSSWLQPSRSPSPLHTAAWLGSSEMCDVILQHEPRLLDFQSEGIPNESPLIVASKQNHPDVVRFLLGKGARADQVSFYYKASPLCAACTAGSYASVKLLLEAAPEMVDVPFFYGGTPLTEACAVGNLKIVEALLEAGGDPSYRSADGLSCISSALRGSRGKRPGILLELLMKYGLDVNAVVSSSGFTVLGAAIAHGSPREVKWLLEHGADPLRSQRSAFEPESWKNALQLAVTVASSSVVDLLLEPQWCLLDHWAESASSGVSPWRDLKLRRRHVESISKVYNACEQARVQTGKDLFTTFMRQPNNLGWTLVDLAVGCASEPEPRQQFSACLASKITQLLAVDYCRELHLDMVEEICWDLFMHRGFDREAIAMLSAAISVPTINRTRGEILEGTEALDTCGGCEDGIRELCLACPLCREFRCTKCAALPDNQVFHEHDWVEIPLRWDPEWKPERHRIDLEKINEQLVRSPELDSDQEVLDDESEKTVRDPYPSEHLQASLQLATLHALGYLAIRRPLFTAYMPLSPATEALIAPWMPVIREQRRHIERRDLSYEMHWTRRLEEMLYLQRGLGVGYHDVEDVRRGWVLQDMRYLWRLPEREETPKRQGNGKRDTRGEGKDFSQRER